MQRRNLIKWLGGTSASLAVPVWAQSDTRPIVLGQSAPFSGPSAELGVQMHRGAKVYFDHVNATGGINGRPIQLLTADDGYEPDRCKANTEKLIREDVFALFGYVGTPTCVAALPLAMEARMPFFGPFTGAQALRDPFSRYVFHLRASYYDETALIVNQLTGLGLNKIAVFRQNDSYGQAGLDGVVKALAPQGLAPVAVGKVERNSTDVSAAVQEIVSKRPNAVVQISSYKSCAAFIREARKAGYGGTFYNVSFVGTQALADELGHDSLGVVVSQVMPFPFSNTMTITREYLDAVRRTGGEAKPNYSSIEGYLAAKVLTEGLRRAAGRLLTRETLVSALESIQGVNFGGFMVNFGPRDHVASRFVELSMLTADGRVRR